MKPKRSKEPTLFESTKHSEDRAADMSTHVQIIQHLVRALKRIQDPRTRTTEDTLLASLDTAISAIQQANLTELEAHLGQQMQELKKRSEVALRRRREDLLNAAKSASEFHKSFADYDRIWLFKVSYKEKKVQLHIGSESVCEFLEIDGARLYAKIRECKEQLNHDPFDRDEFFEVFRLSLRFALAHGVGRDGSVPIRDLYLYVILTRNLRAAEFRRRPEGRFFREYTTAQFVYDLARFGESGWAHGDDVLRADQPNMATVGAGKSLTLPNLAQKDQLGAQLARVRIDKGTPSGTERDSRKAR